MLSWINSGGFESQNLRAVKATLTLGQAIRGNAILQPDQPAVVSALFPPLSYQDLQHQIDEIRIQLRQGGFTRSARIGVMLPNGSEAVLAIVAVACSAIAVPLDPRQTSVELERKLEALRLDALLVLRGSPHEEWRAAELQSLTIIKVAPVGDDRQGLTVEVPVSGSPVPDSESSLDAPAFILQTSGTTAQPKLIPFSHANMLAAAARLKAWFDLTPHDRCLSVSPPYYSHGLKVTVFTPILTGGSLAIPTNAAAVDLPEWFDALRPTWYSAGPTLHRAVLDQAKSMADVQAIHTLRFVVSGGAPLPGDVREELQHVLGVPVLEHYGSSEAAQIAANLPPPGPNRPDTCGQPWPETVMIAGEDGSKLRSGEQGEVWVRGPTVTSGYLDAPDLNRAFFVDGWFRTGDLGSLDRDGYLSLHGRLSELINRGGEKISPGEIESALLRHPAVAEAAAFAVPHLRLGEDVAAAVVLHSGTCVTSLDLRRFLQSELTLFKIPHRILIQDRLPKGPTGKVQRRRLEDAFSASAGQSKKSHALTLEIELLHLWRRLLGSEMLTIDDDFFESGGDSLLATEMLIEVERLVGYQVSEAILFEAGTIRQLVSQLIKQAEELTRPCVPAQVGGDQRPLFFFHGDFVDGATQLRQLVRLLGPDQPVIAIDPHGMHGEPFPPSIEEMAADRLPLILQRQTGGPFLLGGKCNGAMVAFETARQLIAAGHKVDLVIMVDPPTVCAHPVTRMALKLMRFRASPPLLACAHEQMARLERLLSMPPSQAFARIGRMSPVNVVSKVYRCLIKRHFTFPSWDPTAKYIIPMSRYLPTPLDVPVVFYAAAHNGYAWRHISPDVEVVNIPGGHDYCLVAGAEVLVTHLRQRLRPGS